MRTLLGAAPIVDGDDVGVRETGRALRLAPEALHELLVALRVLVPQHLERHVTVQDLIARQVHLRHAPAAQVVGGMVPIVD